MKSVIQLTQDELYELKQRMLCDRNPDISWGELFEADNFVTDEEVFTEFGDTAFTDDDFFCNDAGGYKYA